MQEKIPGCQVTELNRMCHRRCGLRRKNQQRDIDIVKQLEWE